MQGVRWSPEKHALWPARFKEAAREFLLCASSGLACQSALSALPPTSPGKRGKAARGRLVRGRRGTKRHQEQQQVSAPPAADQIGLLVRHPLHTLPAGVLLRILSSAAEPISSWIEAPTSKLIPSGRAMLAELVFGDLLQ